MWIPCSLGLQANSRPFLGSKHLFHVAWVSGGLSVDGYGRSALSSGNAVCPAAVPLGAKALNRCAIAR